MSVIPVATAVVGMDAKGYFDTGPVSHVNAAPLQTLPTLQNPGGAMEFLASCNWPQALSETFIQNVARTPLRFFVCDDSGSMYTNDGNVLAGIGGQTRFITCSRWTEMTTALRFHVNFAQAALAPTEFRLLNGNGPVRIGFSPQDAANVSHLHNAFAEQPTGGTPLCLHIREIAKEIRAVEPQLRAANQRACIVIATDGEASDGDVKDALRPLKDLPCWLILRLCTNDDAVVDYWNGIDQMLEISMDVIDDLCGESKEIKKMNPWLTYAEPLQRMREFGVSLKEFDLLDEHRLSMENMRKLCRTIYGARVDGLPMPELDLRGYCEAIARFNATERKVWGAGHRQLRDWVDTVALYRSYGPRSACCTLM